MADLSRDEMRKLARLGASARLEELRKEEAAIRAAFPDLFGRNRRTRSGTAATSKRRRRSRMSTAARKAVSERMTRYWAERRKAKSKK